MNKAFRIGLVSATLVAGLAFVGAKPASAQVHFSASFPLPHGRLVIGHPSFRVGGFVPFGYRVYARPGYGYGFLYRDRWIPVRRYSDRWIVCESPVAAYGYDGAYAYDDYTYDPGFVTYYSGPRYVYGPRFYAPPRVRVFSRERFDRFDRFDRRDFRDRGRNWDRGRDHGRRDDRGRDHGRGSWNR
ncbi:MAG TPA: hypothetical protein VE007_02445 [Thermoanaerobaculia bacterium]|nr:hypothetical protein [Thermoanaerobaculia bacterium]